MANYVLTSELNTYLWTSWEDILIEELNWLATAYINNFLRINTLNFTEDYEEEQDYNWSNVYMLSQINPANLTLVNWNAVVWQYKLVWRKLTFQYAPANTDNVFNKITFTHDYWFSTITDDIKAVVYEIVWYLYNSRKTSWINSFTQWQISITYDDWKEIQSILDNSVWLKKYIKNDIIC